MFQKLKSPYKVPHVDFKIDSQEIMSFDKYKGSWVVLYFYPKDLTPGCTTEAIEFQSLIEQFKDMNAKVIGVSKDSCQSHKKFMDKHNLNFSLISDENEAVCNAFDVLKEKKMFGKVFKGINRETFLITPEGMVVGHWPNVKPQGHAADVLNVLKTFK